MTQYNWVVSPEKFLSRQKVQYLTETVHARAKAALQKGDKVAVRDCFVIELGLSTGLRVAEMAALAISDLYFTPETPSLYVRKGKGNKSRLVHFSISFQNRCLKYIKWKQQIGEPIEPNDPLIYSSNSKTHMTTRALEKVFKRSARRANLSPHYSIHCLRHTYGCYLYKASGYNLRLVQKQLGHSKSRTTEVYADVMMPDMKKTLERLYQQ